MTAPAILAPLFVQVALTFVLLFWMGTVRVRSLRARETRMGDIALGEANWPRRVLQVSNAYHNQFQLPVLFYILTALALFLRKADLVFVVLAWLFVASRIVHAAIHTTSNDLRLRFTAFVAGAVVLLVMWVLFMFRIMFGL